MLISNNSLISLAVLGILSTVESALPSQFLLGDVVAKFGVPWISISVSFNVLVTAIISSRLMVAHRQLKRFTMATQRQRYAGVTALLVESALPLAISGILFAIFYGKNSPAAIAFGNTWGAMVVSSNTSDDSIPRVTSSYFCSRESHLNS